MRRLLVALLLVALALAGCGGADAPDGPTALAVTVWPAGEGQGPAVTATVTCDPAAGDVSDVEAACALLAADGADALAPVPADAICTELYGGPAEALVEGTVDGAPVTARLTRMNGCEIDRWERLAPLLPAFEPVPL